MKKVDKVPFIIQVKPKEPLVTITGVRRNLRTTTKKLWMPMSVIRKAHIYHAISMMNWCQKKAAKYVLQALKQTLHHAIH